MIVSGESYFLCYQEEFLKLNPGHFVPPNEFSCVPALYKEVPAEYQGTPLTLVWLQSQPLRLGQKRCDPSQGKPGFSLAWTGQV